MKIIFQRNIFASQITFFLFIFLIFSIKTIAQSNDSIIIGKIEIFGNKNTKNIIIFRELTFNNQDTLSRKELVQKIETSKNNLLKMPLFNFVYVDTIFKQNNRVNINITVEERWYLWPELIFAYADRNFSTWLKRKDFTRVNFGGGLMKYNFRGMNERIRFLGVLGYETAFIFSYTGIFLDKKRRSSIAFYTSIRQQNSLDYKIFENKLLTVKEGKKHSIQSYSTTVKYTYRKEIFNSHSLFLEYQNKQISDTILTLNPDYLGAAHTKVNFFSLEYIFNRDKKDSRSYPLQGYSFLLSGKKVGFDLKNKELNFFSVFSRFSKYEKFSQRFYGAASIVAKKTVGRQPFFLGNAIGYQNNLRGYEYFVINGTDFVLLNTSFKFAVIKPRIINLKFVPLKKFRKVHYALYFELFSDFGYVHNKDNLLEDYNTFVNKPLYSIGIGTNIVAYYDTVIRLEYSIIHTGQKGFFVHFKAPF